MANEPAIALARHGWTKSASMCVSTLALTSIATCASLLLRLALLMISLSPLMSGGWCCAQPPAAAGPDLVDTSRAANYAARLKSLQETRVKLRERSANLLTQNPNLEQELFQAMRTQMAAAGALDVTPRITAIPQLLQSWQVYRGHSGDLILRPELLVLYAFQDNTFLRQQLFFNLAAADRAATQSYVILSSNRVALEQIAATADKNFLEFRRLGDLLGRRSSTELAEAEMLAAAWHQEDPLHAGAALVRAHALRSMGRFDECNRLLNELDNNYPAMQSIALTVAGQIAFLSGDFDQAHQLLDKAVALSRDSGSEEAFLVYGWISIAEKRWSNAKNFAARARQLSVDNPEVAILEAMATVLERNTRSREALQMLRRVQLHTSPDDWQYHEALAIAHIAAGDRQFAKREIASALAVAPSHARNELLNEQQDIDAGRVPQIDWQTRLIRHWRR